MARFKNTDRGDSKRQAKRKALAKHRRAVRSIKYATTDLEAIFA